MDLIKDSSVYSGYSRSKASLLDQAFYGQIGRWAATLRDREFGDKHFTTARETFAALEADERIKSLGIKPYEENAALGKRLLAGGFYYYQPRGRYHQPWLLQLEMSREQFRYTEVWNPLLIQLRHVKVRHIGRLAGIFGHQELGGLLAVALAFSKALEETPELQGRLDADGVNILLPDLEGLYLCHAQNIKDDEPDLQINIDRRRIGGRYSAHDSGPTWQPRVRIFINSYVAKKDFLGQQPKIYEGFRSFFADREILEAVRALYFKSSFNVFAPKMAIFTEKGMDENLSGLKLNELIKKGEQAMSRLVPRVHELIRSPAWAWVFEKYRGNPPSLDVAEDGECYRPMLAPTAARQLLGFAPRP